MGELDNESSILKFREASWHKSVALFVVDDEQLTTGVIFPPKPDIATDRVVAGIVLDLWAHEHRGAEREGRARRNEFSGEGDLRQVHAVDRKFRFQRKLRTSLDPAAATVYCWNWLSSDTDIRPCRDVPACSRDSRCMSAHSGDALCVRRCSGPR